MLSGSLINSGSVVRILAIYGRSEETWSRKKKLKEKRDPALKRISIPFACSSLLRLKQSKGRFSGGAWVARGAALSSLSSSTVLQFKAKKELATIYMDGPAALPDIFDRIFFPFVSFMACLLHVFMMVEDQERNIREGSSHYSIQRLPAFKGRTSFFVSTKLSNYVYTSVGADCLR